MTAENDPRRWRERPSTRRQQLGVWRQCVAALRLPSASPTRPPCRQHSPQSFPKRLRQLESVAGRGLLHGNSGKPGVPAFAHYMTLAARQAGETVWRLVYRSEEVRGVSPELRQWRRLRCGCNYACLRS